MPYREATAKLQELIRRQDKVLTVMHPPSASLARVMEAAGAETGFVGTGGVVGSYTGMEDVGTATLQECIMIVGWIARAVRFPVILNGDTGQGSQFTSEAFIGLLSEQGIQISMDGKGRDLDNILVERLWRSVKYEEVYLKAYQSGTEARRGIGAYLEFYNRERPHQALGYQTPGQVFQEAATNPAEAFIQSVGDRPSSGRLS